MVGVCGGVDDLNHVADCEGYETRPDGFITGDPKQVAQYLIKLNAERTRRWGIPLIFIRGV